MTDQDASYELESREQIIEARILRLSLVSLPTSPTPPCSLGFYLQPTRRGANTARSTGLCSQYNVFCDILLAARRSYQRG